MHGVPLRLESRLLQVHSWCSLALQVLFQVGFRQLLMVRRERYVAKGEKKKRAREVERVPVACSGGLSSLTCTFS